MKQRINQLIFGLLLAGSWTANAQQTVKPQLYFNGVGRAVLSNSNLTGDLMKNDSLSTDKGLSGYMLFDLQPQIKINENLKANVILRVRNPFGSFFGSGTTFAFRQFQMMGRIADVVEYEIGDVYLDKMSKYTINNPDEMYSAFESDIFRDRRGILEYENFNLGNRWRLQGVQARSGFDLDKGIDQLNINAFAVRTNPTNDKDVADRIMAGSRVGVVQSKMLALGVNYVGLQDLAISTAAINYNNHVLTGDIGFTPIDNGNLLLSFEGETGFSNYKYTRFSDDSTVSYSDYFYELGTRGKVKSAKLKFNLSYRNVGYTYSSPSAQTLRNNILTTPQLFSTVNNGGTDRSQILFDRFTDEFNYNRSVSAVLYQYLPQYGNVLPYGEATPNRTGLSLGLASDTSAKIINAELRADLLNEIKGEGVEEKRSFLGIRGGVLVNLGDYLKWSKKMGIKVGARYEKTTRDGLAPIDFSSLLIDAGLTVEIINKIDLMFGAKILSAKGNEYLSTRNEFNLWEPFPYYNLDQQEMIYSGGARLRFSEKSYFLLNYNVSNYKNKLTTTNSYNMGQFFANYTLMF